MLKLRYFSRLASAFLNRFKGLMFLGLILGLAIFVTANFLSPMIFGKNNQRIGITGRYRVKDIPPAILGEVSLGLTKLDSQGTVEPGLANSWTQRENGRIWEFVLADGTKWQDGKPVTVADFNFELEGVKVEKPDEKTIVFVLQDPFSPFPVVLSSPVFKKGLLGTGEWRVAKLSLVSGFVEKLVLTDKNNNRKIYKFYPTEERTKLAFQLGEVDRIEDIISPLPISNWKTAATKSLINEQRYVAVFFNLGDPLLSTKELRLALSYAIDKNAFEGTRALGPISPNSWGFNSQTKPYNFDPDRAKELIEELPKEVKEKLTIKLTTTSTLLPIAEKVVKYWKEIGIDASVQVTQAIPTEYQAFLAMYDIPADPDQYVTWHSSQKQTNISRYANPRIDKLLEDGRTTIDQTERKKIYLDFQRYLLEDAPAAFLYHPISYTIERK